MKKQPQISEEEQTSEDSASSEDQEGQSKSEVSVDESASFLKQGPGTPSDYSDKSFSTGNMLFFVPLL